MKALGCDHGGYELKQEIKKYLDEKGIEYKDYGCDSLDSVDYPIYAKKVAHAILDGECEKGILICGTGIGISITANKFKGIRAAVCIFITVIDNRLNTCLNNCLGTFITWKTISPSGIPTL